MYSVKYYIRKQNSLTIFILENCNFNTDNLGDEIKMSDCVTVNGDNSLLWY